MPQVRNGELLEIAAKIGVHVVYGRALVPRAYKVHPEKLIVVMSRCRVRQVWPHARMNE